MLCCDITHTKRCKEDTETVCTQQLQIPRMLSRMPTAITVGTGKQLNKEPVANTHPANPNTMDTLDIQPESCIASSRHSPSIRRRREKQDFFRKNSPLSSTDLLSADREVKRKKSFTLDPTGRRAYNWLVVVVIAFVYFTWSVSLRSSFSTVENTWWLWIILDTLFYSVYVGDLLIQMRTSYLKDGILEDDLFKMRYFYTKTIHFKLDFLSILPLDWVYLFLFWSLPPAPLQFFKLFKVYRLWQFYTRTESRSHFPNTCRVLFLMHNLLVIIHWNACIYFGLSQWIGVGSDQWVYPAWNQTHNKVWGDLSRQYIYSFYWSTLTLTTIGELPEPQTNFEYTFVTADYLVGILMFATLVGNVGSIIANTQKYKTKFQNKMDNIKQYMKTTNVPNNLQERVIKWFDYLWSHGHPVDEQQALNALPDKLKAEIGIHVHFETLKKVDFFEECEQGLLWELVLRLRTQVYSPGEYVCRKGDVGREMYIVNNGKLEVLADENGEAFKQLTHGEYFGEISVLNLGLGKSHRRRTAFVRSMGYSALLCLSQVDLLDVLKDYPKTMEMLVEKGKTKLGDNHNMEEDDSSSQDEVEEKKSRSSSIMSSDIDDDLSSEFSYARRLSEMSEIAPPLELRSVADQIIDVNVRLSHMEELLKNFLNEVKSHAPPNCKVVATNRGTLSTIKERIRKISSQI